MGEDLGRTPTIAEVVERSPATRWQVTEKFEPFTTLVEEAGFEPSLRPVRNREVESKVVNHPKPIRASHPMAE